MRSPEEILTALDPEQRQAAECLRGPVAVLAGAGTGKTRTITHRIAYGVATGAYDPQRVLAVTFTRKAAGELQGRLREMGAGTVRAQTFHGAALAQLGHFWPEFVGGSAPRIVQGKVQTIAQAAETMRLRLGGDALRDVASEIEWRKVSMLSLDTYAGIADARPLPAGVSVEQMLELHDRYAKLLEERRLIDFEDVLTLTAGLLAAEPRAAMQVHERYRFFTVDEFQDVSPLQRQLLVAWLGQREDLCVVGDASQTIYSFAGASSSYLLRFSTEFEGARVFRLERNYRSTAEIVGVANHLMREQPGALTLRALRSERGPVPRAEWFASEHDEAVSVARSIRERIDRGIPASDIAVLYRTNAQSERIETQLARLGISSQVHGAARFFDRADVKQAVMLLRGQSKVADPRPLFQVVSDVLRSLGWSTQEPEGDAARDRWRALGAILALVDEQPAGTSMAQFSEELLARARTHHEPTLDSVTLSAVHSAKGLEWRVVHLVGMSEGLFPIAHAKDEAAIDEERRLAYVAFTRARDELLVSGTASGTRDARTPSRFLAEAGIDFAR